MTPQDFTFLVTTASVVITVLGAWFAIQKFVAPFFKRIRKWMTTWEHFMEDWFGEDERPGVPARAGVMERLATLDHELKPNNGGSIKDAVNRIEKDVKRMDNRLEDGNTRFDSIEQRLDSLEKNL